MENSMGVPQKVKTRTTMKYRNSICQRNENSQQPRYEINLCLSMNGQIKKIWYTVSIPWTQPITDRKCMRAGGMVQLQGACKKPWV